MALLERIRGRSFSQLAYLRYSAIGMTLFLFLLYFGLRNDLTGSRLEALVRLRRRWPASAQSTSAASRSGAAPPSSSSR